MKASIKTREELSFTQRDPQGRLINWPRNNPGVAEDWDKGLAFFDDEVSILAFHDETEAFNAIMWAIIGMGGSHWSQDANSSNGGNSYRPAVANPPSCSNCGYPEHLHPQLNNGPWRNAPCTFTRRTNDRRY